MAPTSLTRNVQELRWPEFNVKYPDTHDHSKWAISADAKHPWVLILDLNRMKSQFKRGGGGICIKHPGLWQAFAKMIVRLD